MDSLKIVELTLDGFRQFGEVIEVRGNGFSVNENRGHRYPQASPDNLRTAAKENISLYQLRASELPVTIKVMECHPHSTQIFSPINAEQFLTVVTPPGPIPQMALAKAFVSSKNQGIMYAPGVWHTPLFSLGRDGLFLCHIYEDGSAQDCLEVEIDPIQVARV